MMPSLGVASFLESIIIPIPLEAVLIPLMQQRRERLWTLAGGALLGCVAGAAVGYFVGQLFMGTAGQWMVETLEAGDQMERAKQAMNANGFWFVMTVSVVPVPFQIAMLAAGATGYPFGWFMVATLISRGVRYFGLALLVYLVGDQAEAWVTKNKWLATIVLVVLVGGGWALSAWLG
jgi:membrane protein YqaA with SNARE-associated domain